MTRRVDSVYVVLAALFGLALAAINPPFAAPDERAHFLRAYQVSELRLLPTRDGDRQGGVLPASLDRVAHACIVARRGRASGELTVARIAELARTPLDPDARAFANFTGTASYPPVPYLPQAFAIALGRLAGLGPVALLYLVRAANLAASIALIRLALRTAPAFRWALLLVALTPMTVYLAASASADAPLDALAFVVVALALRLRADRLDDAMRTAGPWTARGRAGVFVAASVLLALCKPGYFLLPGLALIVPPADAGRRWAHVARCAALVAICAGLSVLWAHRAGEASVMHLARVEASPAGQIRAIADDPPRFAGMLLRDMAGGFTTMMKEAYCRLGSQDGELPAGLWGGGAAVLAVVALTDAGAAMALRLRAKLVISAITLATAAGVYAMVYVSQDAVAAPEIAGVQGRYFIPLVPLFASLLCRDRESVFDGDERGPRAARWLVVAWIAVAAASMVRLLVTTYWTAA